MRFGSLWSSREQNGQAHKLLRPSSPSFRPQQGSLQPYPPTGILRAALAGPFGFCPEHQCHQPWTLLISQPSTSPFHHLKPPLFQAPAKSRGPSQRRVSPAPTPTTALGLPKSRWISLRSIFPQMPQLRLRHTLSKGSVAH